MKLYKSWSPRVPKNRGKKVSKKIENDQRKNSRAFPKAEENISKFKGSNEQPRRVDENQPITKHIIVKFQNSGKRAYKFLES